MRETAHSTELELPRRGWEPIWAKKQSSLRPVGRDRGRTDADLGTADKLHGSVLFQSGLSLTLASSRYVDRSLALPLSAVLTSVRLLTSFTHM